MYLLGQMEPNGDPLQWGDSVFVLWQHSLPLLHCTLHWNTAATPI